MANKTIRQPADAGRATLLSAVENRGLHLETISRLLGRAPSFMADFIYKGEPEAIYRSDIERLKEILNDPDISLPILDEIASVDGPVVGRGAWRTRVA